MSWHDSAIAPSESLASTTAGITRTSGPIAALRAALAAEEWSEALKVLSKSWVLLIEEFPADLDAAFQAVPLDLFHTVPGMFAVREIWLTTSIEPQHVVPAEAPTPAMDYSDSLQSLVGGHQVLDDINLAAAHMVAARMGGRLRDALGHARRVEVLGEILERTVPAARQIRYPLALLQAGITRAVAADISGALPMLQSAYERSPYGRSEYVAKGAAGNLALFNAIRGDIDVARRWLARHDERPSSPSPHTERVLFTGNMARTLIAIESLDRDGAEDALSRLEQGVNVEQTWGPVVTFLHARHGLVWGDRYRALAWVQRDLDRYAVRLGPDSTMGPLLVAAEIDLLLSVGRGDQALARLNRIASHPLLDVPRARLELLTGNADEAARLAVRAADFTQWSRVRLEGLVVQAQAAVRGGHSRIAREAIRMAEDSSRATGSVVPLAGIAEQDRNALQLDASEGASITLGRPMFPAAVPVIRLTNQELLMLKGLASFGSQKELAEAMFLSLNTVKSHVRMAYQKLGVSSRAEALMVAGSAGLL